MATMTINNQGNLISVEIGANVGYFAISDIPEIFSINKDTLQVKSRFYLPYMQAELPLSEISINGSTPADVAAFDAALATLSTVATSGGSGGSSLLPVTGTGTATGDVVGLIGSHKLTVNDGSTDLLSIDPSTNLSVLKAADEFGYSSLTLYGSTVAGGSITLTASYIINMGNVGIGATPTADRLFLVNDGSNDLLYIDTTTKETQIMATDGTAFADFYSQAISSDPNVNASIDVGDGIGNGFIQLVSDASNGYIFDLFSYNGTNTVEILGDAVANTVTITAGAGVSLSAPASTTAAILANGTISFYLDEVGNNLKVAVKYSDGTTKTGTVALV